MVRQSGPPLLDTAIRNVEHPMRSIVLLRPGMYIGSTEQVKRPEWVYNERKMKMQLKTLRVSPALLTLFDEILVRVSTVCMQTFGENANLSLRNGC